MALAELPLATAEFLAVDVETNGAPGEDCELTEIGAVLVGGGELHDRFESLVRQRKLTALAGSLGIEVEISHRALADAETCARVFCALFGRLCANAATVGEAIALLAPRRRRRTGRGPPPGRLAGDSMPAGLDLSGLPAAPGVYVFRDAAGRPLYVGKSVSLRTRARAHFQPGAERAGWTAHAAVVDHRETGSELGALVLENRLIKALRPPGNGTL